MKTNNIENVQIDSEIYKKYKRAFKYALEMTEKESKQAVEGLFHNLNTLQSRSGNQLPFTSINFGTCTLPEGRMFTKAILETSIKGLGKYGRTSIFPCSIFQYMKGVNDKPGTPNYDLKQLALKSTSLRLYPNYANNNWSSNLNCIEQDKHEKEMYLNSLSMQDYEKLVYELETDPELCKQLGLEIIDE